jgi:hypothetical protein
MRLRGPLITLGVALAVVAANAASLRKCEFTGMSAKCGDAKSVVVCEGYDQEHFMADDEKVSNLEVILYVGRPDINRKFEPGYALIKSPRATFRDYSIVLAWYNDSLLKGTSFKPEDYYVTAVEDVQSALKDRKPNIVLGSEDNMSLGTFEISADSPLYNGCYKSKGVASMKTPLTPEQEQELKEQVRRQQEKKKEQEKLNQLSAKYGAKISEDNSSDWLFTEAVAKKRVRITSCELAEKDGIGFTNDSGGTSFIYDSKAQEEIFKYTGLTHSDCKR